MSAEHNKFFHTPSFEDNLNFNLIRKDPHDSNFKHNAKITTNIRYHVCNKYDLKHNKLFSTAAAPRKQYRLTTLSTSISDTITTSITKYSFSSGKNRFLEEFTSLEVKDLVVKVAPCGNARFNTHFIEI